MPEINASAAQYSFTVAGQVFQVLHFAATEEISQLSRYTLTLWSDDPAVDIASLVRQDADLKIAWAEKEKHLFGLVSSFSQTGAGKPGLGGVDQEWGEYTAEVVPTFWLLNQKTNCRIFQEMGADAIIKKVLDERGMAGKYAMRAGAKPKREYCVQYRETDYAFVSRLMEEEGMFFYFTHDGKEELQIGDDQAHFNASEPDPEVRFKTGSGGLAPGEEYLSSLSYTEAATVGKIVFKDYDYREPTKPLKVSVDQGPSNDLEVYDYHPERYLDDGRGLKLAGVLGDAEGCWAKVISADGTWRSAGAGRTVTLSGVYRSDLDGEWLITSMTHTASQGADTGVEYATSFVAIPVEVTFRQFPSTPKPVLGPQTATVVGPPGTHVHMDALGRAKVQFHWDREGANDEHSSCFIRVAQPFAGMDQDSHHKHGFQWHPQVGDEVVVDFLEGDPDRPVIVGSVYNADNPPLVKPEELTRQMILTRYQHRLLMDDRNGSISLNTGGNQRLVEADKGEGNGKIVLATSGNETLTMEDANDASGNAIELRTADDHAIMMRSGENKAGIVIQTNHGHRLQLGDEQDNVLLRTTGQHMLAMSDPEQALILETTAHRKLLINDKTGEIVLTSPDGTQLQINDTMQKILIEGGTHATSLEMDYGKGYIRLRSLTSDVTVEAVGTLTLHGGHVKIASDTDITMQAESEIKVTTKKAVVDADVEIDLKSNDISVDGTGQVSVKAGGELSLQGQGRASVSGGTVDVSGDTLTSVSGAVVKIN